MYIYLPKYVWWVSKILALIFKHLNEKYHIIIKRTIWVLLHKNICRYLLSNERSEPSKLHPGKHSAYSAKLW